MAAPPHKAFSGKVESGFPSENAAKSMKHFQEMLARAKAGVESGFVRVMAAGERNAWGNAPIAA
jgi:hypothetical protein